MYGFPEEVSHEESDAERGCLLDQWMVGEAG